MKKLLAGVIECIVYDRISKMYASIRNYSHISRYHLYMFVAACVQLILMMNVERILVTTSLWKHSWFALMGKS